MPLFVLASASPRRQELLGLSEIPFQVQPASVPEISLSGETAAEFVQRMSQLKAAAAAQASPPEAIIIGADTEVALDQKIYGKPASREHATELLRSLRGRTHLVLTGITVLDNQTGARLTDLVTARVPMLAYSDDEIEAYVATGDPLDKAGAYAIQFEDFQPVDLARFQDCYANVMGLPVCRVLRLVRRLRPALVLPSPARLLGDCQRFDPAQCPFVPALKLARVRSAR